MSTDALDGDDRAPMGLVTDHAEWKPVLDALESEGIPASAATIQQEHRWDRQAVRYFLGPHVKIEVRDARTWAMNESERIGLDAKLRTAAPPEWNGPDLVILWCRPVAKEWAGAWLDAIDKLWRDWRRRRIADDAFEDAREALSVLHRRVWDETEDHGPLLPKIAEILAQARCRPASIATVSAVVTGRSRRCRGDERFAAHRDRVSAPAGRFSSGWLEASLARCRRVHCRWLVDRGVQAQFRDEVCAGGSLAGWADGRLRNVCLARRQSVQSSRRR
ncbi:hypothetical protein EDE08_1219 [Bradyrhizobium sp. R2.2-H]|nr:hypothetical protein EDE10_12557 [Bradyrhizobium sp. Y-H1]TCU64723.1 hypothetical protein EDE08_1219 [Bradyrhizobium sp. R2.2-H]